MTELESLIYESGMTEDDARRYLNIPTKLFDQYLSGERPLECITAGRMEALIGMIHQEACDIATGRRHHDIISLRTIGWPRSAAEGILGLAKEIIKRDNQRKEQESFERRRQYY